MSYENKAVSATAANSTRSLLNLCLISAFGRVRDGCQLSSYCVVLSISKFLLLE